jgi:hypothetical protein
MQLSVQGLRSECVHEFRNNGLDANKQLPQRHIAQPGNNPCRHCLQFINPGEELLLLSSVSCRQTGDDCREANR